jgi:uncharacterized ubiquitin-like protein YukD
MANITVKVTDATGSRREDVEMPDDQPVIRILAALVQKMNLPLAGPDGQPMSYRFHHAESQSQLRDNQTLSQSNVKNGDTLRLVPEITAG